MDRSRKEIRRVAYCPHCGNSAPQRLLHTQRFLEQAWDSSGQETEPSPWSSFVAECEACGRILVYDNIADQLGDEEFARGELEYPKTDRLPVSVPARVATAYLEAARIKRIAPNAFAVQIRRAVEAICEDRKAKGRNLYARLGNLVKRGEMPPVLAKATDILRLLGNIGAHSSDQSVHPLQVQAMDDFFRAIIEYIYVAPSKIAQFEDRLNKASRSSRDQKTDADCE